MERPIRGAARRLAASTVVLVAAALAATGLAGTASAAPDRTAAKANSHWLAGQLSADGTLENPLGAALPDHGLMIDVLYAMHASGNARLAAPIVDYLDDRGHASDYFTWDGLVPDMGYDAIIVGGAAAKILVAAQVSGRDPRNFDGYDMVEEVTLAIKRSGPDRGRVSNYSKNPDFADFVSNDANMFGQSLAVIGLAAAGANDQLAIDTLLTQQCSEGYFRIFFGYIPTEETGDHVTPNGYKVSTCDEGMPFDQSAPDGDATGFALSAMLAARAAGASGLDAPIARTVAWLETNQDNGGGWGGGVNTEAPNTNSTGLIVQALAQAGGSDAAIGRGVEYLRSAQAGSADADTGLTGDIGAIAYNPQQYRDAKGTGISGVDTWIRASAQASLGLSQVGFYDLALGRVPGGGEEPTTPPTTSPTTTKPTKKPTPTTTPAREQPTTSTTRPSRSPRAGAPAPRPGLPTTLVPPTTAPPPPPPAATPAARHAAHLAGQLIGGDHIEVTQNGETFVDYDATADLALALRTLGEQPEAAGRATDFLLDPASVKAYAHGAPYEKADAAYAEPLAKLIVLARFHRAGDSVLTPLRDALAALRAPDGRFTDTGEFADSGGTVRAHAWASLATIADPTSDGAAEPVAALIAAQCADGGFPAKLGAGECAESDPAATAVAVLALNAVPANTPPRAPGAGAPAGWSAERAPALARAATALDALPGADGLVRGPDGKPDVALSAAVAGARNATGRDVGTTKQAFTGLMAPDGSVTGVPAESARAAAAGVAGRSWLSAPGAPVFPAMGVSTAIVDGSGAAPSSATAKPWAPFACTGIGLLTAAVLFFLLRNTFRNPKAVSR
ncbi:hypothetical protein ACFPM7_05690 [Actinokineospora guangxiensis]|uniref:Prenyltransferase/squalene oxidase-like repeat protein n=1 Tax=Actinokineospora guangxiensis TaxID=1490288 RepID=A0ABW0EHT3_9PSEU